MNYQQIYDNLMKKGLGRTKKQGLYFEKHHKIPRCLGGSNDPSNLVLLTPEEHYLAHQLLIKIHPNNGRLIHAAVMMTTKLSVRSNKCYGWLRQKLSQEMKLKNPNKGGVARLKYIEKFGIPKANTRNKPETLKQLSQRMKDDNPIFKIDRNPHATYVLKLDPHTKEILHTYNTMGETLRTENFSSNFFNKVDTGKVYKGFLWERRKTI